MGLLGGTVAFLTTCYWIVVAVNRYGGIALPGAFAVLLLLCLYLGTYWGVFCIGLLYFHRIRLVLGGSALWVVLEYLRGHLLSGFPWAMLSHSQWRILPLLQILDLTGAYGLSFLLCAVNLSLHLGFTNPKGIWKVLPITMVLFGLVLGYGFLKLKGPPPRTSFKVGIIQGNVNQSEKWDRSLKERILKVHETLTVEILQENPHLILWPETAFPGYFPQDRLSDKMLELSQKGKVPILFGSLRRESGRVYNSAFLISRGKIMGHYDKVHLVPFGEYLPLRDLLEGLFGPFEETVPGDISPGRTVEVFETPLGRFSVLICFEIIFPDLSRAAVRGGADFLVTITNDAWFGRTSAPYQHLAQAVFRAVEVRRWVLRSANTGVSAVVDPRGRILAETPIFRRLAFTAPFGLSAERTLYVRLGDWFPGLSILIFILSASLQRQGPDRPS